MLRAIPPMSNAERQRRFCARNPGYYARIQRRKRGSAAAITAAAEAFMAALAANESQALAAPAAGSPQTLPRESTRDGDVAPAL